MFGVHINNNTLNNRRCLQDIDVYSRIFLAGAAARRLVGLLATTNVERRGGRWVGVNGGGIVTLKLILNEPQCHNPLPSISQH